MESTYPTNGDLARTAASGPPAAAAAAAPDAAPKQRRKKEKVTATAWALPVAPRLPDLSPHVHRL